MSTDRVAVAMGGSGARCAEALTYLCAAGLGPRELSIVVADADTQNGNVDRAMKVMGLYGKLQGDPSQRDASPLFGTTLVALSENVWSPFPRTSRISLEDHFGYSAMAMSPSPDVNAGARLMEALYIRDQRTAKLNIGFRGKPSIGAAVCADTLDLAQSPWAHVANSLSVNSGQQQQSWVFGMGSVFGGMGAAGLPVIPPLLKKGVAAGREHVRLGALLLLPYFSLKRAPRELSETVYALPELFALNSREALRYYADQHEGFNDFYVCGTDGGPEQPEFALGAKTQTNPPHFVEFVGALAALRFFESPVGQDEGVHLLAVKNRAEFGWGDVPNVSHVQPALNDLARVCSFYVTSVFPVIERIHRAEVKPNSAILRTPWYRDFVQRRGIEPKNPEHWDWYRAFRSFAVHYLCWLRDLQENPGKATVSLFDSQGLGDLSRSDENPTVPTSQFCGDQTRQGVRLGLGTVWRNFCHICAGSPERSLAPLRAFERKLFAAASHEG